METEIRHILRRFKVTDEEVSRIARDIQTPDRQAVFVDPDPEWVPHMFTFWIEDGTLRHTRQFAFQLWDRQKDPPALCYGCDAELGPREVSEFLHKCRFCGAD